ncbi:hypothetical protein IMSHALPRED_010575 [Imshaugia aleurites]|uniref:NmrA-like domain-containing protein n=1 Tax=Imshaugia aleurites TaxID=172621 RepID=A0A8H3EWW7_9LECA|nr:hypothetical protein IMSHALPRED_010575 [Imshaugia aleurites]
MVKVAIAGASGGLGAIILSAIVDTRNNEVVVLSRSPNPSLTAKGVDVRLGSPTPTMHPSPPPSTDHEMSESQLAIVAAAKEVGVERFAPSEYAIEDYRDWDLYAGKYRIFMDTLGTGTPKGETEALGGLRPWTFIINMKAETADLPGDWNSKLTLTRTQDIGKLVAAALDPDRWEEEMGMNVTKKKMLVKENTEEDVKKMIQEVEGARFYNQVRLSIAQGEGVVESTLNKKAPHIKPWIVEEYLERYWSGVELGEAAWEEGNIIM